jgi:competence protein ComFB
MNIHNVMEELVIAEVNKICDSFEKAPVAKPQAPICTCEQCRQDAACLVLNKMHPFYIISGRGLIKAELESMQNHQDNADIATLSYNALLQVKQRQRPNCDHTLRKPAQAAASPPALFHIPATVGRLFNGVNFEPMRDVEIALYEDGVLVAMGDSNWQNPCRLVSRTQGAYTFWPAPVPSDALGENRIFKYSLKVEAPGMEPLYHFYEIPVQSAVPHAPKALERTFKLTDLYLFPLDA